MWINFCDIIHYIIFEHRICDVVHIIESKMKPKPSKFATNEQKEEEEKINPRTKSRTNFWLRTKKIKETPRCAIDYHRRAQIFFYGLIHLSCVRLNIFVQ